MSTYSDIALKSINIFNKYQDDYFLLAGNMHSYGAFKMAYFKDDGHVEWQRQSGVL